MLCSRPLTGDDLPAIIRLGREAFGHDPPVSAQPSAADWPFPGRHEVGTFDATADGERLVARVVSREYHAWFHGVERATNGVAGVAVDAEHRGSRLLQGLVDRTLAHGFETRGEAVSTLYPTAAGIYRPFGYEVIGSLDTVTLPMSALTALPRIEGVVLRRAGRADLPAVRASYAAWAARHNGPLTRTGPSFPATDDQVLDEFTGTTVAEDEAGLAGYASWVRGPGYTESSHVEVLDLFARSADAYRALLRMIGTFSSVAGSVRLRTSGDDVARLVLPGAAWPVTERHPYMLRVHDVPAALTGLSLGIAGEVVLSVVGDPLGVADGSYVLTVADGRSSCLRTPPGDGPVLDPRGLALLYAGAQSCASIRSVGLMSGSDAHDPLLDAMLGTRRPHVRDYF